MRPLRSAWRQLMMVGVAVVLLYAAVWVVYQLSYGVPPDVLPLYIVSVIIILIVGAPTFLIMMMHDLWKVLFR